MGHDDWCELDATERISPPFAGTATIPPLYARKRVSPLITRLFGATPTAPMLSTDDAFSIRAISTKEPRQSAGPNGLGTCTPEEHEADVLSAVRNITRRFSACM